MSRQYARTQAFKFLYELEIMNDDLPEQRRLFLTIYPFQNAHDLAFFDELVRGVRDNLSAIDETIRPYLRKWSLDRLPTVDRCILRLAVYEMLIGKTVAPPIAISEAMLLAKEYADEGAHQYINGVLGSITRANPTEG